MTWSGDRPTTSSSSCTLLAGSRSRCRVVDAERVADDLKPTRLRGFSDAYGSWKIICISRRNGRSSFRDSCVMSAPSNIDRPARRLVEAHEQAAEGRLAAARLADHAERLAPAHLERDAVDRVHLVVRAR